MRFIIDAQLPPGLARWLPEAGHDTRHVEEVGLRHSEAQPSWRYAHENKAIIITRHEGFADRVRQSITSPVIVWLRLGNISNRVLQRWFIPQLPQIIA